MGNFHIASEQRTAHVGTHQVMRLQDTFMSVSSLREPFSIAHNENKNDTLDALIIDGYSPTMRSSFLQYAHSLCWGYLHGIAKRCLGGIFMESQRFIFRIGFPIIQELPMPLTRDRLGGSDPTPSVFLE